MCMKNQFTAEESFLVAPTARSVTSAALLESSPLIDLFHLQFGELCGSSMRLKCKLPTERLVSITCYEDLANVIEEYDRVSVLTNKEMKIRALLSPINLPKKESRPYSPLSCFDFPASSLKPGKVARFNSPPSYAVARRLFSPAVDYSIGKRTDGEELYYPYCGYGSVRPLFYVVPLHCQ
ncbi:hypothetical protein RDI58_016277 [Solanum bulbocastanum]|uniref:PB1 domain-containing protein n=1 Tax=Solanum bulbocastanum TaxID=147425 RepID=A0AAN8YCR5_SOLBU